MDKKRILTIFRLQAPPIVPSFTKNPLPQRIPKSWLHGHTNITVTPISKSRFLRLNNGKSRFHGQKMAKYCSRQKEKKITVSRSNKWQIMVYGTCWGRPRSGRVLRNQGRYNVIHDLTKSNVRMHWWWYVEEGRHVTQLTSSLDLSRKNSLASSLVHHMMLKTTSMLFYGHNTKFKQNLCEIIIKQIKVYIYI